MPFFPCAHAGHSQWQHATKQVVVQLKAQITMQQLDRGPSLGLVYVSQAYAGHASAIFAMLADGLPEVQQWVGCGVASVLGGDLDYGEVGALAVLLPCIDPSDFTVFSDQQPWPQGRHALQGHLALVHGHADGMADAPLAALQSALPGARVVGGLSALPQGQAQVVRGPDAASHIPASIGGAGVQRGGISGVVFGTGVQMLAISMQGCRPLGNSLTATQVDGTCLLALDQQAALDVLLDHLALHPQMAASPQAAYDIWGKVQRTLLALSPQATRNDGKCIQPQARAQPIVGLDPLRRGLVLNEAVPLGYAVTLCQSDEAATRAEIRRACAEISEALLPEAMACATPYAAAAQSHGFCISGAIYVRSQRRQQPPKTVQLDAELQLIRHALGPVPLLGFTSACEVEDGALQYLSAQLIVFVQALQPL